MKWGHFAHVTRCAFLALVLAGTFGHAWAQSASNGMVALRIDAGRAARDQVELHIGSCIAREFPPPPALGTAAPAGALRDALFPWLEPGVLPVYADEIAALLATSRVANKLEALGVRYLLTFSARAVDKDVVPALVSLQQLGWYGLQREDVIYGLDFIIWDARNKSVLDARHTEWKRAIGVLGVGLPIPFVYSTKAEACDAVMDAVRSAVATER